MNHIAGALQRFFAGFGLNAYGRDNVPDGARMPYITYETLCPPPMRSAALRAWVWYRGHDHRPVWRKCDEIAAALRDGGACVDGVYLFVDGRVPFAQEQTDPHDDARAVCLSLRVMGDEQGVG